MMLISILALFEILMFSFICISVIYIFTFSVAGMRALNAPTSKIKKNNKIAVLIPAYKEDNVIVSTAFHATKQSYSHDNYDVIIIADSLRPQTLQKLKELPIKLLEVSFSKSTKVKSLNTALSQISNDYDIAVVLDADNVMETDFLLKINNIFNAGKKVIQGRRVAKNNNTSFAVLDGLSEIINNHIFRKGYNSLGLSASLIGSGMAFDFHVFKSTLAGMDAVGGFDRELHSLLVGQGYKSYYLKDAIVYDEKIENSSNFTNQRKRWLSSQVFYLRKNFKKGINALFKGKFNYFDATVLSNLILPRVLIIGCISCMVVISLIFNAYTLIPTIGWLSLLMINIITYLLAVPLSFYSVRFFKSLIKLPQAFILMLISLFSIKGVNKSFIHTPHNVSDIDCTSSIKEQ